MKKKCLHVVGFFVVVVFFITIPFSLFLSVFLEEIDVQLVTLIKSLVNPDSVILESSTTEAVVVSSTDSILLLFSQHFSPFLC